MTEQRKPTGDYEVGYAKPPEGTRFKKGQSGNPRGRTKKQLDLKVLLAALTQQPVSVIRDGRRVRISSLEAMLLSNYNKALKGDARSFDRFLKLLDRHGIAMPREEAEAVPLDENEEEIIAAFLRNQGPERDAA